MNAVNGESGAEGASGLPRRQGVMQQTQWNPAVQHVVPGLVSVHAHACVVHLRRGVEAADSEDGAAEGSLWAELPYMKD